MRAVSSRPHWGVRQARAVSGRQQSVRDGQVGCVVRGRLAGLGRTLGLASAGPWQGVGGVFVFVLGKLRPYVSKKNCLLFNENFPAYKPYRLLESILATTYSRHKSFINRTPESFPVQNASFIILSRNPSYKSKAANVRILPADPE